jgi:hypothetical protein
MLMAQRLRKPTFHQRDRGETLCLQSDMGLVQGPGEYKFTLTLEGSDGDTRYVNKDNAICTFSPHDWDTIVVGTIVALPTALIMFIIGRMWG